jgi:branched-chain amino acid transport system ATP-binding protein
MSLLEVKDLHKDFSGLKVLTEINLSIERGERHSIIGPNGAGKSTLFNMITGKYRPSRGKIFFDGEDITGLSPYKISRRGLARSFQIINIFPIMNVYNNIRNAILSKNKIRLNPFLRLQKMERIGQETVNILETFGLIGLRDIPAGELSYGQQRALEIGIALATEPKLILLDEPTAGMSKEETRQTVALIQNVTKGKTLVMIEHDLDVVFSIADKITVLNYGEIIASGTPDEIRSNEKVKKAYLGKKADARSF